MTSTRDPSSSQMFPVLFAETAGIPWTALNFPRSALRSLLPPSRGHGRSRESVGKSVVHLVLHGASGEYFYASHVSMHVLIPLSTSTHSDPCWPSVLAFKEELWHFGSFWIIFLNSVSTASASKADQRMDGRVSDCRRYCCATSAAPKHGIFIA